MKPLKMADLLKADDIEFEKLEKLLSDLRKRLYPLRAFAPGEGDFGMMQSVEIKNIAGALCKAQKIMANAEKDAKNPHFKSTYASLAAVRDACNGPLTENGLSVVQTLEPMGDSAVAVRTTLLHTSGEWISSLLPLFLQKQDMQGMGSAITYARRYALAGIVGIAQEDDDANKASAPLPADPVDSKPKSANDPRPKGNARSRVNAAAEIHKWTVPDLRKYGELIYEVQSLDEMSPEDIEAFIKTISTQKPDAAIKIAHAEVEALRRRAEKEFMAQPEAWPEDK